MTRPASGTEGDPALPRVVGTWKRAYALVLLVLAADIVAMWALARLFG